MVQFSVYVRFCACEELSKKYRKIIRDALPERGHVWVMAVTDKQFEKTENYVGKLENPIKNAPQQLTFF
jgi:CRISPR-associated protein Cas2